MIAEHTCNTCDNGRVPSTENDVPYANTIRGYEIIQLGPRINADG